MHEKQEEKFWTLVTECLCTILSYKPIQARRESQAYRQAIESKCKQLKAVNVIYHETPVHVACDIAGSDLTNAYFSKFQKLLSVPKDSQKVATMTPAENKLSALRATEKNMLPASKKSATGKRAAASSEQNTKKIAAPRKKAR